MQIKFRRRIRKVGGSYMVAIPQEVLRALEFKGNEEVEIFVEDDKIIIKKF